MTLYVSEGFAQNKAKRSMQRLIHKTDSLLTQKYERTNFDTNYIRRPKTKLTLTGRLNFSGQRIRTNGVTSEGMHFSSRADADYKATVSIGANYAGVGLNLSLNPGKLAGKYHDYELNFSKYGNTWGGEISYQDAKNFKGWYDREGIGKQDIPGDVLHLKTLNINFYYAFNHRKFSYPAAFSQTYIQRHSAGSALLAMSYQGLWGDSESPEGLLRLRINNIGIGGGYGYNCVPSEKWLLHISAMPTIVVYSHASATLDDKRTPLHYHFPEVIITGRGAVVRNFSRSFMGMSMVFNFSNVWDGTNEIRNFKWLMRMFYGIRL